MAGQSRLAIAKPDIVKLFDESPKSVYRFQDLSGILASHRGFWRLAQRTGPGEFVDYLLKNSRLQKHEIEFPHRPVTRYTWGNVDLLNLVQSIDDKGYFTHYSAILLHGLTDQLPKSVYFNVEQQAAGGGGELTQEGINRAFQGKPRVSSNVATYDGNRIIMVSGKNTASLGLTQLDTSYGSALRVTDLERTLIDITVRPVYSGGVFEVALAFDEAAIKCSVNRLCAYLKQLKYTYPYHQAIGYYMERSSKYKKSQLDLMRQFPMEFDFYLTHGTRAKKYVEEWRLFVPDGF